MGAPAKREMVAEILFQGLLTPTVEYSVLNGYTKSQTLGKKNLGLEEIEGIVVANEYANLDTGKTLGSSKTLLRTADRDYTLNVTSGLDEIGEYRYTYVIPAAGSRNSDLTCTGLFGDEANKTWEDTDGKKVSDSGIDTDDKTEKFVNFGDGTTYETSNYLIRYVISETVGTDDDKDTLTTNAAVDAVVGADLKEDWGYEGWKYTAIMDNGAQVQEGGKYLWKATYTVTIKAKTEITKKQLDEIHGIFNGADTQHDYEDTKEYIDGEVYIGTQSYKDISDTISYDEFLETYIKSSENAIDVKQNDKGNWLKVIDNNNDGVAEYVFKVVYTMAQIAKVKDSTVTLDVKNEYLNDAAQNWTKIGHKDSDLNAVTDQGVNCNYDDPAAGDVIYYAVIDGKVQAYKADVVSAVKIDKVNRNTLTATVDGTDYVQSEVHEHIVDPAYGEGVRNLVVGKVTYDLFLDRGGYLAAFVKSELGGNLALLTDGWFMAQRGGDEYAAKVYNRETKEQDDTTIVSGGPLFILSSGDNNQWKQLKYFGDTNDGTLVGDLNADTVGNVVTTMVGVLDEDGNLLPVDDESVYTRTTKRMVAVNNDEIVKDKYLKGVDYTTSRGADTAYNTEGADCEIRALTDTVYYYVYPAGKNVVVREYVGYNNLPSLTKDDLNEIEDVYAVGTLQGRESGYHDWSYYTADVVVVEFKSYKAAAEAVFVYDFPVVTTQTKSRAIDDIQIIDSNGEVKTVSIDVVSSYGFTNVKNNHGFVPGLYWMYETAEEGIYKIEALDHDEINDTNFVVGQVATTNGTAAKAYTEIGLCQWDDVNEEVKYLGFDNADSSDDHAVRYLTDDSKYYTLDYELTSDSRDWEADLNESDWETTLAEGVDKISLKDVNKYTYRVTDVNGDVWYRDVYTNNGASWHNNNEVLMLTKGNGDIVWAVSLERLYTDANGYEQTGSFAYQAWERCLPEYTAPGQITFDVVLDDDETIQINGGDIITGTKPLDRHSVTIEVPVDNKGVVSFTAKVGGGAELHSVFTVTGWSIAREPVYDAEKDIWTITLLKDGVNTMSLDYAPSTSAVAALYTTAAVEDIVAAAETVSEADRAEMIALLKNIQKGTIEEADATVAESVDAIVAEMAGEDELAAAAAALTDAKAAYDADDQNDTKKQAMYKAAAAFTAAGGDEADETYAAVVAVAQDDANEFVTANTTATSTATLQNYAAVKDAVLTEAVEDLAALTGSTTPTDSNYATAKTAGEKKVALYDAAKALVEAASAEDVATTGKTAYLAALEKYNTAVTAASVDVTNFSDYNTYSFGTGLVSLKTAVELVQTVDPKDAVAKVTVKNPTKVELRAVEGESNEYELIYVGSDAATEIAKLTSWATLKVLINITAENTDDTIEDSDAVDNNVFTKEFTSNGGGEDVTVTITILEPDDAWKVAADKAALEEAFADGLTVDLAAPSKANAISEIETQISDLITKATEGSGDNATVVTFAGDAWKAPANVGDEEICSFNVKVTLTSGEEKAVIETVVEVTVVKVDGN